MGRKKPLTNITRDREPAPDAPGFEKLDEALKGFVHAMRRVLLEKHNEGLKGWDDPAWIQERGTENWRGRVSNLIEDCSYSGFREKDCVNLANYMLFQFHHQKTAVSRLKKKFGGK